MRYAVIDTNVIIAAQLTRHDDSATRRIIKAVFAEIVTPIVTPAILAEYAEVMSRKKFKIAQEVVSSVLSYFGRYGHHVIPVAYSGGLIDEKDRPFLEAVLAMFDEDACLITGNAKHFPQAPFIVSPAEFVTMIDAD
jgi:putative PIN family toxin of toxin-antitoxin system